MTTDLRRVALKNRNYYLSEKKADNGASKWFRYVRTMDTYSEPVLISPKMAQEMLDSDDDSSLRKPVSPAVLEAIANDLRREKAHPTLSISFSGKLLDGRNVLQALLLNKKSAIVFVSFNISDKLSFLF
jgi:hypothetical protein